ncbi:CBS domain-containing protein [Desulfoplanes sp.]
MLLVKDVMSTEVITLKENDTLSAARSVMQLAKIRHVPVVDGSNQFSGLITQRDILSAAVSKLAGIDRETQREIDAGIPIREVMRKDTQTIESGDSLVDAAGILLKNKYGCLPVVEAGRLLGIVTEADFIMLTIHLLAAQEKT